MKYAGIGLVAISLCMAGICAAGLIRNRFYTLNEVLLFFSVLESCIGYSRLPLPCAVQEASGEGSLHRLDFLGECAGLCQRGVDFPDAWAKAVNESRCMLKKQERLYLIQLGKSLSGCEPDGQKRLFSHYRETFMQSRSKAAEDKRKYAPLVLASGVLGALLAVVILL